jgi:hypothetical protein
MGAASTASWPDIAELIPLSSAALIAYYNISVQSADTRASELAPRLDAVATAIASLVPVYIVEDGIARRLSKLELMLCEIRGGGARLVHRDLTCTDLRVSRCDLLEAIHALQDAPRAAAR